MRRIALLAPALFVTLLSGCASDVRNEALTRTTNGYASSVRWNDWESAQSFLDKDYVVEHPLNSVEQGRLGQLRVTGYDDGAGPRADGEDDAVQIVQINVVNINTQAERTVIDRQRWHYDREKKKWWLMTGLPDFSPK
ncbi:MAG TPA: hypothetical protein VM621_05445 [Luteibacter sp.]|uniref:hypothetical protein n=1 Tax=Luteibacter sp. TaxID=1886636 RepID=UPI002B510B4D|nr:hypothetical protein [Luteibacter sp.]HVI54481.1 hypothetical protein [Luteibacter sp.]